MTEQPKHTPTPWAVGEHKGDILILRDTKGKLVQVIANMMIGNTEADAYHIVKCVNAHDELVAILEDARKFKGGWREAIVELEDHCSERVRLKNMLAATDSLDDWAKKVDAIIAKLKGGA